MKRVALIALSLVVLSDSAASSEKLPRSGTVGNEEFVVHFALNSARVSGEGRAIIRRSADRSRALAVIRVEVTGHSDQSGSPEYNLLLSRRRTDAVVRELRRSGVANALLHVDWKGEFTPLQNTSTDADSVNRRVTIALLY
jgi:outer membrane protein OmpA-like peptidoglycan-associated protein